MGERAAVAKEQLGSEPEDCSSSWGRDTGEPTADLESSTKGNEDVGDSYVIVGGREHAYHSPGPVAEWS